MVADISVMTNLAQFERELSDLAKRQLPYATALGLTSLSKMVAADEVRNLSAKLKSPSPFTLRSVRSIPARKDTLTARVFVMDKAAAYLEPYEKGGVHKLPGRALLNPKDVALNQYGQLRRGALAALKGRSDIFIGPVKTKKGIVNGVWQRTAATAKITNSKTGKTRMSKRGVNTTGALKLLIRFGDALAVRTRLGYQARAAAIVNGNFNVEMEKAMVKALGSARS